MTDNGSGDSVALARMTQLVNRARGAMNLLLVMSAVVFMGNWDSGPTRFAAFNYGRVVNMLENAGDFIPEEGFRGLLLPEARKAAGEALKAADAAYKEARGAGDRERAAKLLDARIQLRRSKNQMDLSREQQLTVSAFAYPTVEILGFSVPAGRAGGLLSLVATGLLLYLICVVRTMRRYPIAGSDWIFHLDGRLPVVLGGCWLLLPAFAVTTATGQLLWELVASGILLIDSSMLFLLMQLVAGILAPLLLGGLATWLAWKTR